MTRQRTGASPALAVALAVAACAGRTAGAGEARSVGEPSRERGSPACILGRAPLTLSGGLFPYIEPEALIRVGAGFVVAGTPSYTWAPGTPGDSLPLTTDLHLAARFTLDGRATLVEKPVRGEVGSVRVVPLGGDRWGALFDEVEPDPRSGIPRTVSLWYGEHGGSGWSRLERVPIPEGREIDFSSGSELVAVGEDLVWIVAARLPSRLSELVQYERRAGSWRHEVVADDWVETSALAYAPGDGLWMAHFSGNPGVRKSLKVYRRGASWELVKSVGDITPGAALPDLGITLSAAGTAVSWRVEGPGDSGAYALSGLGRGQSGAFSVLDRDALQLVSLPPLEGRARWLVTHLDEANRASELRLLRARPLFGAERTATAPSPYLAFLASLALERGDVLVVGPEVSSDPADPFVRSLILRLSGSCT